MNFYPLPISQMDFLLDWGAGVVLLTLQKFLIWNSC